jgi:hypothetical protein
MNSAVAFTDAEKHHFALPSSANKEARQALRKRFSGRVKVLADGALVRGKVFDVSLTGASILRDDLLRSGRKLVQVQFEIFHNGKNYAFEAPAAPVYSVLVSGSGYKIGMQFGTLADTHMVTLGRLMEA